MKHDVWMHQGRAVYQFKEEKQFHNIRNVRPTCAILGGGLTFRLPRAQDTTALFSDISSKDRESIRWYSYTASQADQTSCFMLKSTEI